MIDIRTQGAFLHNGNWLDAASGHVNHLQSPESARKGTIAHRILKALFFIVKQGRHYHELGEEYLTRRNKGVKIIQLTREAERLGYRLVLTPQK